MFAFLKVCTCLVIYDIIKKPVLFLISFLSQLFLPVDWPAPNLYYIALFRANYNWTKSNISAAALYTVHTVAEYGIVGCPWPIWRMHNWQVSLHNVPSYPHMICLWRAALFGPVLPPVVYKNKKIRTWKSI